MPIQPYKGNKDIFVLASCDELTEALEDSLLKVSAIVSHKYSKPFRLWVQQFKEQLKYVEDVLEQWLMLQVSWTYLENIFNSPDIQ